MAVYQKAVTLVRPARCQGASVCLGTCLGWRDRGKMATKLQIMLFILTVFAVIFRVNYSIQITEKILRAVWKERYPALLGSPGVLLQITQSAG